MDIKDAFYHVPIHWWFQVFFAFVVDGKVHIFQYMPFGLSIAPWTFNRVIKPIKVYVHCLIRFHDYMDDFLILVRSV